MKNFAFYLGLAFLCTHELDALPNHEWRVLPLLNSLPEDIGQVVFVAGHVPLFAILIALTASLKPQTRRVSRIGVSAFLAVHAIGHALSVGDPSYEFTSTLSEVLIFGGGFFGTLFLIFEWRERGARNMTGHN